MSMSASWGTVEVGGRVAADLAGAASRDREAGERGERRPIVGTRRLTFGALDEGARRALCDSLYPIYRETSVTLDREAFGRLFFRDQTRVAVFLGPDGEIAGFSNATLLRVDHEGVEHAVFGAGVFVRRGYRGGAASAVFGLTEALRFKLANPRVPLAYLCMASSPAPYRLHAQTMGRMYPSRRAPAPAGLEDLVRAVVQKRGLTPVGDSPWRVRSLACPRSPERIRTSQSLRDDPDARFYCEQNPDFAAGEGTALLVWVPLDLANITSALARASLRAARAIFASE